MIPADVASSLRQLLPDAQSALTNPQTQPVVAAQKLADVLSDLVPGQRLMAEIQAALPNGTYRAVVAQRQITLALPFSAKPGDSLELEVRESEGHLTLAVVNETNTTNVKSATPESVSTSLSQTGKLIGNLISGDGNHGSSPPPVALNSSQALVQEMPDTAAQLVPVLKQAISQSGMFYEAHQAKWVSGQFPTAALRLEPQGKIPVPSTPSNGMPTPAVQEAYLAKNDVTTLQALSNTPQFAAPLTTYSESTPQAGFSHLTPTSPSMANVQNATTQALESGTGKASPEPPVTNTPKGSSTDHPSSTLHGEQQQASLLSLGANDSANHPSNAQSASANSYPLSESLQPIVRQQLEGLANNNFAWQGQIWPGQQMEWEIGEPPEHRTRAIPSEEKTWQSRLKLNLPMLGSIEAALRLQPGGKLALEIASTTEASESILRQRADELIKQMAAADLELVQLQFRHERSEA